jgi:hypothetical protein
MVSPSVLAFLLLASPNVLIVSCAAVAPPISIVLAAENVPGVPADVVDVTTVASVPTVVNIPFATAVIAGSAPLLFRQPVVLLSSLM